MKDIIVKIYSNIKVDSDEPDINEVLMPGKFYIKGHYRYITYEETQLTGMSGDKTILKIGKDTFWLKRYGDNNSEMKFKVGESFETKYTTPYGVFMINNTTQKYIDNVSNDGDGYIELLYNLDISGVSTSVNYLKIEIANTHNN